MEKGEDKERKAAVDASKVKEEKLEVAGGKCWKQKWLKVLCFAGEICSMQVIQLSKPRNLQSNMLKAKIEIFPRDLDPAFGRPFCYGGLRSRGHCLLQH